MSAAVGLTLLEDLDAIVAVNRRNYRCYRAELDAVPGVAMLRYDESERNNFQYIVLEIDPARAGLTRDELVEVLWAENVLARRYFHPGCHRMEPYRSYFPHAGLLLPATERVGERVLSLPTGTAVDESAIGTIATLIRTALAHAPDVRRALATGPRTALAAAGAA